MTSTPRDPRSPPPRTSRWAVVSLVLGVVAVVPCVWIYFIPGICAVICGEVARRQIRDYPQRRTGLVMARVGTGLGVVAVLLGVMVLVLLATGHWQWPGQDA